MTRIRKQWGAEIAQACAGTPVPHSLVAALIANESSGKAHAQHLEAGILELLQKIKAGKPVSWHPLKPWQVAPMSEGQMEAYAMGLGLTQITGYHVYPELAQVLLNPARNLRQAVYMLRNFARQIGKLSKTQPWSPDFRAHREMFFRCWNGGSPMAATYSADYVPSGTRRMEIYEDLAHAQPTIPDGSPTPALPRQNGPSVPPAEDAAAAGKERQET